MQLAELEVSQGRVAGAEAHLREAAAMAAEELGQRHFSTNRARGRLGRLLLDGGRAPEEAVELLGRELRNDRRPAWPVCDGAEQHVLLTFSWEHCKLRTT